MATYNGAMYLREQLDSIMAQTVLPYEIIIQDDCSTDQTVSVIQAYESSIPIRLVINTENIGYVRNFETALQRANGDYIALCDQDDRWMPDKLEKLLNILPQYSLVYSNSELIDAQGCSMGKSLSGKLKNRFITAHSPLCFVYDNCVSAHSILFDRALIPMLVPFPNHIYFDAWIAACAANVNGIGYVDEMLVGYRQHTANTLSITQKKKKSIREKIASKAIKKLQDHATRVGIISDLLNIPNLRPSEQKILTELKEEHSAFEKHWFNLKLFSLLLQNKKMLFAITTRNPYKLAINKSIGFKLYRLLPFL